METDKQAQEHGTQAHCERGRGSVQQAYTVLAHVEELLYRLRYGLLATIFIPCAHSVSMGGNGDFEK